MPYKVVGKRVLHLKDGKWSVVPGGSHMTHAEAVKHLAAIMINRKKKGG
jgi:hypothetical protein